MKYLYFFLMSALITSSSQTMNYKKTSIHIQLNTLKHGKTVKVGSNKKSRSKQVPLDQDGIDGIYPSPTNGKKISIPNLSKPCKI